MKRCWRNRERRRIEEIWGFFYLLCSCCSLFACLFALFCFVLVFFYFLLVWVTAGMRRGYRGTAWWEILEFMIWNFQRTNKEIMSKKEIEEGSDLYLLLCRAQLVGISSTYNELYFDYMTMCCQMNSCALIEGQIVLEIL